MQGKPPAKTKRTYIQINDIWYLVYKGFEKDPGYYNSYKKVRLGKNIYPIHKLVAQAWVTPLKYKVELAQIRGEELRIRFIDGNRKNTSASNLLWVFSSQLNKADKYCSDCNDFHDWRGCLTTVDIVEA